MSTSLLAPWRVFFHAELLAAKRAGPLVGGMAAFLVVVIGFLLASAWVIWNRAHRDATLQAAYVEDASQPVPPDIASGPPFPRAQCAERLQTLDSIHQLLEWGWLTSSDAAAKLFSSCVLLAETHA